MREIGATKRVSKLRVVPPFCECIIVLQHACGLKDDSNIDAIINSMIENNVDAFLAQEIWMIGDSITSFRGRTIFHHGFSSHSSSRGERGVDIALSPKFYGFYESAGGALPMCAPTSVDNFMSSRRAGLTLKIRGEFKAKKVLRRKKVKSTVALVRLALACASCDQQNQSRLKTYSTDRTRHVTFNHKHDVGKGGSAQAGIEAVLD